MSHILEGRLRCYLSPDLLEPLPEASLLFYHPDDSGPGRAGSPSPTTAAHLPLVLSAEEVREKEQRLIGRGRTDEQGNFRVGLSELVTGIQYEGGPIEVDVHCTRVYGQTPRDGGEPVRFTVAALQPSWQANGDGNIAKWDHNLSQRFWGEVRSALDAWVIHGRVVSAGSAAPLAGVRVQAFDGDFAQDDVLGSAVTDALGRFRIDYGSDEFRDTPTPWGSFEAGGPDLFFRVESHDGTILLEESKSRGSNPDRENATSIFFADLHVKTAARRR